jgi:hypothetical protein
MLSAILLPVATLPRLQKGRPRVAEIPDEREKHLAVAKARLLFGARVKELARYHGVDVRTIRRWIGMALGYDCPEAVRLRRLTVGRD